MKQHSVPLLALALCAGIAFAQQAPVRSSTSPRAAGVGFSSGGTPSTTGAPNTRNPVAVAPGTGTAALPIGAPSPSGLASPSPFPAGIPSTTIAAPGTSAAITAPTTVSPSVGGTAGAVTGGTRGVVNPGVNVPLATGVIGPAGNAANVMDPSGAASAGNAGAAISVGTPGAPTSGATVITPGVSTTGATVAGAGLTGGVPSVSAMGAAPGQRLTALQIAQFFLQADGDRDNLLSRAEALRLPLATMTFEDMDTNRDGSISRSEYEDSLR